MSSLDRYESPYEWVVDKIERATQMELQKLARVLIQVTHIDLLTDLLADLFGLERDEDGYFDPTEG